ncbi:MAG: DUF1284 domain-containing protein [Bdellovibrionales bacterium]|jgi:hypothetical protein
MKSVITLRGHHLLCLLTYVGAGYSEKFKENFNAIVKALNHGHPARIVAGYDSICHNESIFFACPHMDSQKCKNIHEQEMDRLALADLSRHIGKPQKWELGSRLALTEPLTQRMRSAFAKGAIRRACRSCPWESLCTQIAQDSFHQAKLFSPLAVRKNTPLSPLPKTLVILPSNPPKDKELFMG